MFFSLPFIAEVSNCLVDGSHMAILISVLGEVKAAGFVFFFKNIMNLTTQNKNNAIAMMQL